MTFTMMGRDPVSGLLGVCLTSSPYSVGARCPFIAANVGAVSTQAYAHPGLGPLALELLGLGYTSAKVLDELASNDEFSEYRQIGIIDRNGHAAVFTGAENKDWSGCLQGRDWIAMGNYLKGEHIVEAMAAAYHDADGEILEERLMRAIEAGRDAGGERGGQFSSALVVVGNDAYGRTDLRVDWVDKSGPRDAVDDLRRIFDGYQPMIPYYEERPANPLIGDWQSWRDEATGKVWED
jgi:uncharacterized Ntn-hydrolase superfamily protein